MSNANDLELSMLALINGERAAAGLDPLRLITLLNDAAEDHSAWMLEADQFSHQGQGGSTPTERMDEAGYPFEGNYMSAENIGWQSARGEEGFEDDVAQVHQGLMNSPGHRANILDPNTTDIGIGIEIGDFEGFEAVMVTQVFARTEADISAWIDPMTGEDGEAEPPVVPEEPVDETPVDEPVTDGGDEPVADGGDDMPVCPFDDEDIVMVDDEVTDEDDDLVVAMDDEVADDGEDGNTDAPMDDDTAEEGADGDDAESDGEDVAMEDDAGDDADDGGDDAMDDPQPEFAFPCDLANFTVDLSDAFEFRQEGDQLIWETSEEKIMAAFQTAFDEWTAALEAPESDDEMAALMMADLPDVPLGMMAEETDAADEWMMDSCA